MKITALPIRFGIAISSSLIAFFLILSLFNVNTNPFYSFFNAIIIAFGIYDVIKLYKLREGTEFSYSKGFSIGITTGFVATVLFAIFFVFYVSHFRIYCHVSLRGLFSVYASVFADLASLLPLHQSPLRLLCFSGLKVVCVAFIVFIIMYFVSSVYSTRRKKYFFSLFLNKFLRQVRIKKIMKIK